MNTHHSKSFIMLLEIMINICFFAAMISICLVLLFRALRISDRSEDLNHGVTLVNSAAALYEGCSGDTEKTAKSYRYAEAEPDRCFVYFDDQYQECAKKDAAYVLQLTSSVDRYGDPTGDFQFSDLQRESVIYQKDVVLHLPLGRTVSEERQEMQ